MNRFLAISAHSQAHPHAPAWETHSVTRPKILVIWESKHGSTAEICYAIAGALRAHGLRVTLAEAGHFDLDQRFDGYVIGSAVYAGHWMKHIKQFVHENRTQLLSHPVWLFSSGPIGPRSPKDDSPVDVVEMTECTAAVEHRVFAGKLDRAKLAWPERAVVAALGAPYGDFRDWNEIAGWAHGIADTLVAQSLSRKDSEKVTG